MSTAVDLKKHTFASPKFKSVIQAAMRFMIRSPIHPLPPADRFPGAGVYALYYCGNFDHYDHIVVADQKGANAPIYARSVGLRGRVCTRGHYRPEWSGSGLGSDNCSRHQPTTYYCKPNLRN